MSHCLNCEYWKRTEDGIIGMCRKQELPGENYRFQYEGCRFYVEGERRFPYNEKGYAKRMRDYSNITVEPEVEAQAVALLKQGVKVVDISKQLHIGAQVMSAITRKHKAEHEAGKKLRRANEPDPLDAYAAEFKRLLDSGASYYKVQTVTGINQQRVSAYVQRRGWIALEANNGR
jgi:hypothetical protein